MGRFASRRKSFRRRVGAKKKLHWYTVVVDDMHDLQNGTTHPADTTFWKRLNLLSGAQLQSNELLSERATLIRVVTQLKMYVYDRPYEQSESGTFHHESSWLYTLVAGNDVENAEHPYAELPNEAAWPFEPDYWLTHDVIKTDVATFTGSGSYTGNIGGYDAFQYTAGGMPVELAMSTKCRRRLTEESLIYLDFCPFQGNNGDACFEATISGGSIAAVPSNHTIRHRMEGVVRFLIAI